VTTLIGVIALMPAAVEVVRAVWLLGTIVTRVAPSEIPTAFAIWFATFLLLILARIPWIVLLLIGLYLLFGETAVRISQSKVSVYKVVGRLRLYFGGTSVASGGTRVETVQDHRGRWAVSIVPGPDAASSKGRPAVFGAGALTGTQAAGIAKAIDEHFTSASAAHA
jgi:hypothetical protein